MSEAYHKTANVFLEIKFDQENNTIKEINTFGNELLNKGENMSRFDYVKYDEKAVEHQNILKARISDIEETVNNLIDCPRSKALVMTKLEEAYMWMGKGIRNDQIGRNIGSTELQEERCNS